MTSLFELNELEDQVALPANTELEQSNYTVLNGTDGDDTIDSNFVDSDGDTMSQSYDIYAGAGDDYIEVDGILQGGYYGRNIWLGEGADTLNFVPEQDHENIDIFDFKAEDTIQLNGVTLNWSTFNELDFTYDEFGSEFALWNGQVDIFFHDTTLDAVLGERGAVDGTSEADLIDSAFVDVDGDVLFDGGNEVIAGQGNDTVIAGSGDDTIYGISGNNVIDGGEGDDEIHTGRHTSEIDAGYGSDIIYTDLSKGADHVVDLGEYDWDQDELHLENVSLDRASHVTVKGWNTYDDQLYIGESSVAFEDLSDGMTLSQNEDSDAVLSFGDDDTLTFENVSLRDLIGTYSDYVLSGTDGDDWMDAAYVDADYDTLQTVNEINPGAGNDYVEVSAEDYLAINLEDGSDTINVTLDNSYIGYIQIYSFSDDDTLQLNGQDVTLDLLADLDINVSEDYYYDSVYLENYDSDNPVCIVLYGSDFNFLHEYQEGVNGTNGDDLITSDYSDRDGESVGDGDDLVNAGDGNDIVKGYNGADTLYGGSGDDAVYGDRGNNALFGEDGDDTLDSGRHSSILEGGDGNDYLIASMHKGGDHVLSGGEGFDTVELRYHEASKISNIVIQDFNPDQDTLKLGDELLDLSNLPEGATLANNEDDNAVLTLATGDTVEFENITTNDLLGIVEPNEQVDGTDYADVINFDFVDGEGEMVGNTDDLVYAGSGQDTVYGYRGADTIYGGSGHDEIDGLKGQNELYGETGDDTISSGKHTSLLNGGHGDDMLLADIGSGGDHTLTGGTGYDRLYLDDASDKKLSAVVVSDFDPEQDTLVIDDTVVEFDNLMSGWSLSENEDGHAVLSFNDDDTVTLQGVGLSDLGIELPEPGTVGIVDGTSGIDIIDETFSDYEGDILTDGDDTIMAGAGDDEVITDRGNDIVYGGAGNDYIGSLRGSNEL